MNRFGVLIFTDIVLGAIAILIVIIVVNRPRNQTTTHIPQADVVLTCQTVQQGQLLISLAGPETPAMAFDQFINSHTNTPKLSLKLLLQRNDKNPADRKCAGMIRTAVKKYNKAYEADRKNIKLPYLFFTETLKLENPE
jgi:hypothetical protein